MSTELFNKNLEFIREKQEALDMLRHGSYRDAAAEFCHKNNGEISADDVSRIYEDICGNNIKVEPNTDFAAFCKAFSPLLSTQGNISFADDDGDTTDEFPYPTVAYLKNAFSDKAYRRFAETFDKVSAVYFPGFREVCEEVYYGRCSHAILPIYSYTDGQLLSFRRLISKYDLKIVCCADIEMSDESVMRYALLKRGLGAVLPVNGRTFLDFSVVIDGSFGCGEFLVACESLGCVVQNVTSYPREYSGVSDLLSLLLDITDADQNALRLFLNGSHIRYTVDGTYNVL